MQSNNPLNLRRPINLPLLLLLNPTSSLPTTATATTAAAIHNPTIPTPTGPTRSLCSGNATRITCFIHPRLPVSRTTNTAAATQRDDVDVVEVPSHRTWILDPDLIQTISDAFFFTIYTLASLSSFVSARSSRKVGVGQPF